MMTTYRFYIHNLPVLLLGLLLLQCQPSAPLPPPNILWITCEDISPQLACYGDPYARTPHLDQLAREGVLYTQAFASAPVCAIARSSIISGMHPAALGSQHMRCTGRWPEALKTYPEYLRAAGYYCTNNVKTDYNLDFDPQSIWDASSNEAHWRNRTRPDQPFFAIFNFVSSHESRVNELERHQAAVKQLPPDQLQKAGSIPVPPYFPDTEVVRELWTRYYNNITAMDAQVGEVLAQLEADGLAENTIVMFYSDHGAGVPRYKRWLYDTGLRVPWIVRVPPRYLHLIPHAPGTQTDELVSFIDLPPTVLRLAGLSVPENMVGRPFMGAQPDPPRSYIYASRDRMDERYDMQRAVRDKRFKYIRYYEAYKPYCQYMNTPEQGGIMQAIRTAAAEGTLPEAGQHMVRDSKPTEELFDTEADPLELHNLAGDPAYAKVLATMRAAHAAWSDETKDTGLIPEAIIRLWEIEQERPIYEIMRSEEIPVAAIRETALGDKSVAALLQDLHHPNAAVRYWAAIHLGNQAIALPGTKELQQALTDPVSVVRTAAARALLKIEAFPSALMILRTELAGPHEWERLHAALVLDEIGKRARSLIPDMQAQLQDENKYVVRVVNHALNQLQGTDHVVN